VTELGAALNGTAPEAAPGKTRKGTQLYLRSADRDGWDVEVEPREVGPDGGFEVESLPAGRYYAWQHVFTTVGEAHGKLGPAAADVCRKHEWAGVPVVLEAGGKAALKDLAATPAGNVKVRVIDAGGQPVPSAYIFLRDQNPEFWIRDDEAAAGAASEAPIAHVVNGAAELRDVRAGGLDFELLAGTGRVYSVVAQVEPGRLLEVRLPKEDR